MQISKTMSKKRNNKKKRMNKTKKGKGTFLPFCKSTGGTGRHVNDL